MPASTPTPFLSLATAQPKPGQRVPSPCVGVCRLTDDRSICVGCWRTLDELRRWSSSSDAEKRAIWHQVEKRQRAQSTAPAPEQGG